MEDWSEQSVRYLKGVGPKVAEKLLKLGILTQRDVLFHLPLRYEDRTTVTAIGALQAGAKSLIQAEVMQAATSFRRQGRSRRVLVAKMADHSGLLTIRLFYFNARQQQMLEKGNWLRCYGEVRTARGELEMVHPEIEIIDIGLHQLSIAKIVHQVIDKLATDGMAETLPSNWLEQHHFPDFKTAMLHLHSPDEQHDTELIADYAHPAQFRFIVEELTAHRLALLALRARIRVRENPAIKTSGGLISKFIGQLPFDLTQAQKRVTRELMQDFESGKPMMRLLQGDVGCGKTVVAALACLPVVESGFQCALMAPTEILAEQHRRNFSDWLSPMGLQVICLTGADKGTRRTQKLEMIASGEANIVIGTHALFQVSVSFQALGFIIIDEQHRFGVDQRLALQKKTTRNEMPHQLIMTATPIPRTLAMSIYADLDYSQIDEMPPGRKPVITSVVAENQRGHLIERVARACEQGGQVYWVCTLIEESEELQLESAERTFESLQKQLPAQSIALVHGRMKAAQKQDVIEAFERGDIDILVATTVIEVGVDVANANIMIIENPERLGLSQIHQLRGRIGRGGRESFCILLVKDKLSPLASRRINIIRNHQDGFLIAQKDLELRGAGEVLGTRQSGEASFKIADLMRDMRWFTRVNELAELMQQSGYGTMRKQLMQNWIGHKQGYTEVG
jgi:ATP-dependent DNA helicase RecG